MSKHKAPQFELPHAEQVFNLQSETTVAGTRLQLEQRDLPAGVAGTDARQSLLPLPATNRFTTQTRL
ncbi:MAG TPA: hypothetical protein VMU04_24830 [Candidatus Acidoferrum sp.]|nr:hypothetical protein [Candidatus Acidoferrum sp.]